MTDFLMMGGYGGYVWSAYGVTVAVFLGLAAYIRLRAKRLHERQARGSTKS
ncbi:MAG: hypothetical protein DHS20C05_06580 [Hyphococcus sp.]|nr:MAG: hypothetical protein DHS20C05_06580 [Marinicaulis sp.]